MLVRMKTDYSDDYNRVVAFNVKVYRSLKEGNDFEDIQELFWNSAAQLARNNGFDTVAAGGRMGGWMIPILGGQPIAEDDSSEFQPLLDSFHIQLNELYGEFLNEYFD